MTLEQTIQETLALRFWSKVDKNGPVPEHRPDLGPCWLWKAARNPKGYGIFGKLKAHRVAYELLIGPIPERHTLDHLCRNRACVNPAHTEPVTNKTNILRGISFSAQNARKTHCLRGHPLTGDNLYTYSDGERSCKTCKNMRQRIDYEPTVRPHVS
jgi:hypothetical protein